ncbi:ComF family protein [Maricaulis parjimensis]|uniref:ComF family protein n=1 Tax=Maricaulis parjimensis TaxID=144023 RepID=UPI00193A410C|nr:ComF family protein [Maricaulis parjimensis]
MDRIWNGLADLVWPPVCPLTGARVAGHGLLSQPGWSALTFLDDPCCHTCGLPFAYPGASGSEARHACAPCLAKPPRYDGARAPLAYDDVSRGLVLGFKHGSRHELIDRFANWMELAAPDYLAQADALIPVPLHWRRLLARRYNQSALLARALSRRTGLPVWADVLLRRKPTPSQAGQSAGARRRNMAGAFRVTEPQRVAGKTLVLIDDVLTTGATANACARQLKRAGAKTVYLMTLCRVVRTSDATI